MILQGSRDRVRTSLDAVNIKRLIRPKPYLLVGLLFLGLYFYQYLSDMQWPRLQTWQTDEVYKQVSGYLLSLVMLYQWRLSQVRNFTHQPVVSTLLKNHKWVGAFLPLVFFFHAVHPGYAFLFILAMVFLLNILVALFNAETVLIRCRACLFAWTVVHIVLATLTLILMAYHIYVIYAYS